ncbi:MAG: hypothetical protein P3X24_000130 [bacterium]|nr:hypothetical protein [bacterium]
MSSAWGILWLGHSCPSAFRRRGHRRYDSKQAVAPTLRQQESSRA